MIACYQFGYGIAAFGIGPLLDRGVGLPTVYGVAAAIALGLAALSHVVARRPGRRHSTCSDRRAGDANDSSEGGYVEGRVALCDRPWTGRKENAVSTAVGSHPEHRPRSTGSPELVSLPHRAWSPGSAPRGSSTASRSRSPARSPGAQKPSTLGMTSTQIGLIASIYLVGEVVGALVFGKMSDRLGRKRLLITTLLLYLFGTGLAAFVTGHHTGWLVFFYATRFVAGMGIGGQYAAINSAIDEMMPSKYRGRVDIWINGTYWAGAILGSFASLSSSTPSPPTSAGGWRS